MTTLVRNHASTWQSISARRAYKWMSRSIPAQVMALTEKIPLLQRHEYQRLSVPWTVAIGLSPMAAFLSERRILDKRTQGFCKS